MTERFIIDDAGTLIDIETRNMYDIVEEVVDLLNKQDEIIRSYEEIFQDIIQIRDIEISDHIRFRVCSIVDAKTYGRIKEALKR